MESETLIEAEENEMPVEMHSEECPFCGQMVPLGTLSAHIPECEKKPQEKVVEKIIVKEVPVRMPVPDYPRPSRERNRHYTTSGYYSKDNFSDVRVRKDRMFWSPTEIWN